MKLYKSKRKPVCPLSLVFILLDKEGFQGLRNGWDVGGFILRPATPMHMQEVIRFGGSTMVDDLLGRFDFLFA